LICIKLIIIFISFWNTFKRFAILNMDAIDVQ
jgi:hypothetical protein